jgi:transaldolase
MSNPPHLSELKVKIFADGADLAGIRKIAADPRIKGFTTNPTLMRKAGVGDYRAFAREMLALVPDRPISFEVFADELDAMERQAVEIASWGKNINVKIPVSNTAGESTAPLVGRLSRRGVTVNVTAVFTHDQVAEILAALNPAAPAIVSVFAGRVADSGRDPVPHMKRVVEMAKERPKCEVLWASPREIFNIVQADDVGCHIITIGNDLLGKISNIGKDLEQFSRDTVKMFYDDARAAGYGIGSADTKPRG